MLNALFGNPNLQLIQRHPKYRGPKTLERIVKAYGERNLDLDIKCALDKKRRNAVTDVLRFYNSMECKVSDCPSANASEDQIYSKAYDLSL